MNPPDDTPENAGGEFDELELTAADWVAREEFGLSSDEADALQTWLRSDARHARVYAELKHTGEIIDRHPRVLASGPAEAAGVRLSALADSTGIPRRSDRVSWVRFGAWAAAACFVLVGLFAWARPRAESRPASLVATTQVGELRTVALPDGSVMTLNTASLARVHYTATERRIDLAGGEAWFSVVKDPTRPFSVEAGGVTVRAVGTAFSVRLNSQAVDILVSEGVVRVQAPGDLRSGARPAAEGTGVSQEADVGTPLVAQGSRISVPLTGGALDLRPIGLTADEVHRALAWRDRRLKFDETPLAEVVAEFNRYHAHRWIIADPDLAAQKFGGTLDPRDAATLLHLLEENFGVQAENQGSVTVLRRRATDAL